jgi:hypothetical protein
MVFIGETDIGKVGACNANFFPASPPVQGKAVTMQFKEVLTTDGHG